MDSRKPFRHTQFFVPDESGDKLVRIENTFEQDGKLFAFNNTHSDYLMKMSAVLADGMVLTFQLWGQSWLLMSWLDFMTRCAHSAAFHS